MSEATAELTKLAGRLSLVRRKYPRLTLESLAYGLIEEISRDAERLDRVLASAKLNKTLFISEAPPERRALHQAVVDAALRFKAEKAKEGGQHGFLIR